MGSACFLLSCSYCDLGRGSAGPWAYMVNIWRVYSHFSVNKGSRWHCYRRAVCVAFVSGAAWGLKLLLRRFNFRPSLECRCWNVFHCVQYVNGDWHVALLVVLSAKFTNRQLLELLEVNEPLKTHVFQWRWLYATGPYILHELCPEMDIRNFGPRFHINVLTLLTTCKALYQVVHIVTTVL
jgi:hypothetical protein